MSKNSDLIQDQHRTIRASVAGLTDLAQAFARTGNSKVAEEILAATKTITGAANTMLSNLAFSRDPRDAAVDGMPHHLSQD